VPIPWARAMMLQQPKQQSGLRAREVMLAVVIWPFYTVARKMQLDLAAEYICCETKAAGDVRMNLTVSGGTALLVWCGVSELKDWRFCSAQNQLLELGILWKNSPV